MDKQQQQRINAAAQQFTDALVAASRATSDRSVAAQKLGTQMTGYFFNSVMNNLRTQAEGTRQVRQQLADQQRRAQEATREFTQASTNTYMNLLDSIYSFYQGGTTRAQRRAEEAERRVEEAKRSTEQAESRAEEAERRAEEAERRAEEAERGSSEADSQGGRRSAVSGLRFVEHSPDKRKVGRVECGRDQAPPGLRGQEQGP